MALSANGLRRMPGHIREFNRKELHLSHAFVTNSEWVLPDINIKKHQILDLTFDMPTHRISLGFSR